MVTKIQANTTLTLSALAMSGIAAKPSRVFALWAVTLAGSLPFASFAAQPVTTPIPDVQTTDTLAPEGPNSALTPPPFNTLPREQQLALRNQYLEHLSSLTKSKSVTASSLLQWRSDLQSYPLLPYLEYRHLRKRLNDFPYREIDDFLYTNKDTYLANRLLRDWLYTLERKRHWHDFQSYYSADLGDQILTCHYLRARLLTGDETALEQVGSIWNQGRSLPKACDPLFTLWRAAGGQTAELSWERATKAIANRKLTLTRYITKYAPESIKPDLNRLIEVHRNPHRLNKTQRFSRQDPRTQFIILHGLQRLARKDPQKAALLWERYDAQQLFPDTARRELQESLVAQLARKKFTKEATKLANSMQGYSNTDTLSHLLRSALREQDWPAISRWIQALPSDERQSPRWRYWATRSAEAQGHQLPPYPNIESSYAALAQERSFYGFFAADRLGMNYSLEDEPSQVPLADQRLVRSHPAIQRAKEFFHTDNTSLARAEWYYAARKFSEPQLRAAGALAYQWGWHRKGIQAMIEARAWDDLTVRFPLAFADHMQAQAQALSMDANLLFAVARQESAFAEDARSSAGALGLMQLMPATARQTAGKAGLRYRQLDLLNPAFNIALGSRYLQEMLGRYEGNPALAAAAYNAGPHRVDRWLSNGLDQLPMDIWIETIPFKETRHYVQNVMVFSVIYAYRNGTDIDQLRGATKLPPPGQQDTSASATPKAP